MLFVIAGKHAFTPGFLEGDAETADAAEEIEDVFPVNPALRKRRKPRVWLAMDGAWGWRGNVKFQTRER